MPARRAGATRRSNNAFERKGNEMRPELKNRPPESGSTDAARIDGRESADRTSGRRLGRLEYVLLALIALGVAVTLAMAVVDPSG
jgi:hypothetical protein